MRHNFQFPVVLESRRSKASRISRARRSAYCRTDRRWCRSLRGMLVEAGLDPEKDVTWVETGSGAQAVTALTNGRVDIWGTWDSQIATAENMGVKLRRFTSPYAEKLSFGVRISCATIWSKNARRSSKRCCAVSRWARDGDGQSRRCTQGTLESVPRHQTVKPGRRHGHAPGLHLINTRIEFLKLEPGAKWGELPPVAVTNMIDFMKANGLITGEVKAEDLYTNQFIPAINNFDKRR